MIIDLILDRKDREEEIAAGYTHSQDVNGVLRPIIAYNARDFYMDCMGYFSVGCATQNAEEITAAMDYGTEDDVRRALCKYVIENEYNPDICDYINSRTWID